MLIPCFSRQHNPGFSLFFKSKVSASCHIKCGVATISIATIYHKHYLKTRNVVQDLLGFNQEGLIAYGIQISELIRWYMTFTVQKVLHILFFIFPGLKTRKYEDICGFAAHISNVFSVLPLKLHKSTFQSVHKCVTAHAHYQTA